MTKGRTNKGRNGLERPKTAMTALQTDRHTDRQTDIQTDSPPGRMDRDTQALTDTDFVTRTETGSTMQRTDRWYKVCTVTHQGQRGLTERWPAVFFVFWCHLEASSGTACLKTLSGGPTFPLLFLAAAPGMPAVQTHCTHDSDD